MSPVHMHHVIEVFPLTGKVQILQLALLIYSALTILARPFEIVPLILLVPPRRLANRTQALAPQCRQSRQIALSPCLLSWPPSDEHIYSLAEFARPRAIRLRGERRRVVRGSICLAGLHRVYSFSFQKPLHHYLCQAGHLDHKN